MHCSAVRKLCKIRRIRRPLAAMVLPSNEEGGEASARYREKQDRALVVYHFHKWAAEVDCTLAFIREGEKEIEGTDTIG